jgi:hypothetical protein
MISLRLGRRAALCALAVAIATALAIVPAGSASAEEHPPACAPGQFPSQEHPCMPPPCPEGVQPSPQQPCAPPPPGGQPGGSFCPPTCPGPPAPGTGPQGQGPAGPGGAPCGGGEPRVVSSPNVEPPPGDGPKPNGGPGPCGPPSLAGGFLSRVWRFNADADGYDSASNTLSATVTKILNLPKRFGAQDDDIVDQDAHVLFGAQTKVFDAKGHRVPREASYDSLLDDADKVLVAGKILPPSKWQKDEDGQPVTTIRAKRVTITG